MILMWSGPNMKHSQKPCRICSDISDIFSGGWLKFGHTMELLHAALGRWVSTFRRPGTSAGTKPKVPKYDGFHLCGWLHIYLWPLFVLICPHSYMYIYIQYIHTYIHTNIYIYIHMYIYMYVFRNPTPCAVHRYWKFRDDWKSHRWFNPHWLMVISSSIPCLLVSIWQHALTSLKSPIRKFPSSGYPLLWCLHWFILNQQIVWISNWTQTILSTFYTYSIL